MTAYLGQALDLFTDSSEETIIVQMKPYLQPFEAHLALKELEGLCGAENVHKNLNTYSVSANLEKLDELHFRLAFAQRLGTSHLNPTHQVLRELTQTSKLGEVVKLHSARRLRFGPHDIHEYRGKFFPQLVRALLNYADVPTDGIVLDPMVGSGTTLVEASALGMSAIGVDMNPLSVLISRVKSNLASGLTKRELTESKLFLADVPTKSTSKFFDDIWDTNTLEYLERWYSKSALSDIATLMRKIESEKSTKQSDLYRVVLSGILRTISLQNVDDLRVRKTEKTYKTGEAFTLFKERLFNIIEQLERYSEIQIRGKSNVSEEKFILVKNGDARKVDEVLSKYAGTIDCIITSPPYATALPYLDTDRLSLLILKLLVKGDLKSREALMIGTREVSERQREEWWNHYRENSEELTGEINQLISKVARVNHKAGVGFRRRNLPALLGKYFLDMAKNFEATLNLIKPGGFAFYVVGSNSTSLDGKKLIIKTDILLFNLAEKFGWQPVELIDMELLSSRDMFRENRGSSEKILVLRKPSD